MQKKNYSRKFNLEILIYCDKDDEKVDHRHHHLCAESAKEDEYFSRISLDNKNVYINGD